MVNDRVARLIGVAVVVAVRLWASWTARVPQVVADETAYLAMSRYFAGGSEWNLGESAAYMPLYSLVIAPAELLGLSPDGVYRWAVLANVVLAGATFLTVEALARRTTLLRSPWTVVAAAMATSLPALVLSTRFAWSDNLAPLCFALVLLAGLRLLEAPSPHRAAVFTLGGIVGYLAHSRFLTVLAVMAVTLVVLGTRRALAWVVVAVSVVSMVVGVVVGDLLVDHLTTALNMAARESSEFSRIFQVGDLVMSMLGQLWYLTVTTGGLAAVGAAALLHAGWNRWRRPGGDPGETVGPMGGGELALLIGLIGISFATSAGFMTDRPRPDHLVYGRYNDMFVAPLVVLGLGAVATAWTGLRSVVAGGVAVAVAALTAQLLWSRRLEILTGSFMPGTIMGLFALDPLATQRVRSIAAVGVAVIVVIALLGWAAHALDRVWLLFAGCALILAVGVTRAHATFEERYVQPDPSAVVAVEDLLSGSGRSGDDIVCAMTAGCPLLNFYRYQFYLPDRWFQLTWDESWRGSDVVLGGKEGADADLLSGLGYELLWADPTSHGSVWVR